MYGEVYIGGKLAGYVNSDFRVIYYTEAQLFFFEMITAFGKLYSK